MVLRRVKITNKLNIVHKNGKDKQSLIQSHEVISHNKKFLDHYNAIFKFTSYNLNSLKILINSELWFGKPIKQNDPYEGEFTIDVPEEINLSDKEKILKYANPELKDRSDEDYLNPIFTKDLIRLYQETIKKNIKTNCGICSFTKTYKDKLLWTHYANKYTGFCLVYDKNKLYKSFMDNDDHSIKRFNADYKATLPKVNLNFDHGVHIDKDVFEILKFKHEDYRYESEVRFIEFFYDEEIRSVKFDAQALSSIIFSLFTTEEEMRTIVNIVRAKNIYNHVSFFKQELNIVDRGFRFEGIESHQHSLCKIVFKDQGAIHNSITGFTYFENE